MDRFVGAVVLSSLLSAGVAAQSPPPNVPPCVKPPKGLVGWYPLDETSGTIASEISNGLTGTHAMCTLPLPVPFPGMVLGGLQFENDDGVSVPDTPKLDMGTGDFSIDLWARLDEVICDTPFVRKIEGFTVGYDFGREYYLGPYLEIWDSGGGSSFHFTGGPAVTTWLGIWQHYAVTVNRQSWGAPLVTFYVDGVLMPDVSGATMPTGSLDNSGPFVIGPLTYGGGGEDVLDEIEVFKRVLTPQEVLAIYLKGSGGKCKETCYLPSVLAVWTNATSLTTTLTICNGSSTAQTYTWSMQQTTGQGCTLNTGLSFTLPSSGATETVTIPAGTCSTYPVTINVPTFGALDVACYAPVISGSSVAIECSGKLAAAKPFTCLTFPVGPFDLLPDTPVTPIGDVGGPPNSLFAYSVQAVEAGTLPSSLVARAISPLGASIFGAAANAWIGSPSGVGPWLPHAVTSPLTSDTSVSLLGLPPGTVAHGVGVLAANGQASLPIQVEMPAHVPFRFYDIVVRVDADLDGSTDAVTSFGVYSVLP